MLDQLLELLPLLVDVELSVPQSIHQDGIIHLIQHHIRLQLRAEPVDTEMLPPGRDSSRDTVWGQARTGTQMQCCMTESMERMRHATLGP